MKPPTRTDCIILLLIRESFLPFFCFSVGGSSRLLAHRSNLTVLGANCCHGLETRLRFQAEVNPVSGSKSPLLLLLLLLLLLHVWSSNALKSGMSLLSLLREQARSAKVNRNTSHRGERWSAGSCQVGLAPFVSRPVCRRRFF